MNVRVVLILVFFIGAIVVSIFAPFSPLVRGFIVYVALGAGLVLLLMRHFHEAKRKIPHMNEDR